MSGLKICKSYQYTEVKCQNNVFDLYPVQYHSNSVDADRCHKKCVDYDY